MLRSKRKLVSVFFTYHYSKFANIAAKEIVLKFFEIGHTFISADSVHAGVEKEMRCQKHGNVYIFRGFVEVVKNSNSRRMVVIELKASDFRKWTKLQSQSKIKSPPKISEMKVVRFLRSNLLYYKLSAL